MCPVTPDIFTAPVACIASLQVPAKAAETVRRRMEERFCTIHAADASAGAPAEEIQQCAMSRGRAGSVRGIADAVVSGDLDLAGPYSLSCDEVISRLTAVHGVEIWSVGMFLNSRQCGRIV